MQRLIMRTLFLISLVVSCSYAIKGYGIPGWTCDAEVMKKSASVPTSVHSLRLADINVVGALGDSITAGNGAGAPDETDMLAMHIQYRGLTFSVGGDMDLDEHVTLANVLKKFNPNLFGFSINTGAANVWANAHLNAAVPFSRAVNLKDQSLDLVQKMKDHPDQIDIANDWKLIHIFIGGDDFCLWCNRPEEESPELFGQHISDAVQALKDNLPRTIVVITGMLDVTVMREMDVTSDRCKKEHSISCPCLQSTQFSVEQLRGVCKQYADAEMALQSSGQFDTSDDFTLVIQPFLEETHSAPLLPDGTPDLSLFAPDCFHFSQYGHAVVGKNLWNNLIQPVGEKSTVANMTDLSVPLACPSKSCPFIRTTKNSVDCEKYLTPVSQ